ncbi:MAG: hypothetical protein VX227_03490 [Nitrospinota bacterium]|nr:hypothetical protein [Nitrospinota bacterium]
MSEAEKKIYHFNSNIRSNTGSRSSMTNNEDRYLRALEIQERKRALLEEELEKERKIQELENPTPPPAEESAEVIEEPPAEVEETSANEMEATEPVTEETPAVTETPKPAPVVDTGPKVPGPTPRKDFSSEEKAAMLKRAKAHAAEVAKRKG